MGTSGSFAYKNEGGYYVKVNRYNSCPESLGSKLVSFIPEDPGELKRWLKRTRKIIGKFIEGDNAEESDTLRETDTEFNKTILHDQYFEGLRRDSFEYSSSSPGCGFRLDEWTYVYDLVNEIFVVQGTLYLDMQDIPRGGDGQLWTTLISFDQYECICPTVFASAGFYACWNSSDPIGPQEKEDILLYETTQIDKIEPSAWMNLAEDGFLSPWRELAKIAAEGVISASYSQYWAAEILYKRSFISLAIELLRYASPFGGEFSGDEKVIKSWTEDSDEKGKGKEDIDLAEETSDDVNNMFWFRGCLIVVKTGLDEPNHFKSTVGKVIRRVKSLGLKSCTAILFSTHRVAVVQIAGDNVSCSDAIEVVTAFGKIMEEPEFEQGLGLIAHYLAPACVHGNPSSDKRSCLPIPAGVLHQIMQLSDGESVTMLSRASKAFRHESFAAFRPAFGPYTLLSYEDGYFHAEENGTGKVNPAKLRLAIRYPKVMLYSDYHRDVYRHCGDEKKRERVIYESGDNYDLFPSETGKVVYEFYPRLGFRAREEWKEVIGYSLSKWRLVAVESGKGP